MEKKMSAGVASVSIMRKYILWLIMVTMLALAFVSFSHAQGKEDSRFSFMFNEDGIYKLKYATIKFVPPEGWNYIIWDNLYHIEFAVNQNRAENGTLTISISSTIPSYDLDSIVENIISRMNTLSGDRQNVVVLENKQINFLDTLSRSIIFELQIKHKLIVFKKADKVFKITFSANRENFDILLQKVEESLVDFEIIELKEQFG